MKISWNSRTTLYIYHNLSKDSLCQILSLSGILDFDDLVFCHNETKFVIFPSFCNNIASFFLYCLNNLIIGTNIVCV